MDKGVFIILDGLGDNLIKDLRYKTPLEDAKKQNIDKLVRYSECGLLYIKERGHIPRCIEANLSLLGYDFKYNELIFKALIYKELKEKQFLIEIESKEDPKIEDIYDIIKYKDNNYILIFDNYNKEIIEKLKKYKIKNKTIYKSLNKKDLFENKYKVKALYLSSSLIHLSIAKYLKIDYEKPLGTTGKSNENLFSFSEYAIANRNKYDIIFIHIRAPDILSHLKNPFKKKKIIEEIDEYLIKRIKEYFDAILITGDHSTSSIKGRHISDPVPVMIYSKYSRYGFVKNFSERKCIKGTLGVLNSKDIIKIFIDRLK
jgi:2,3-bisphosphoglycerate-independent phosphoglycerate mutase